MRNESRMGQISSGRPESRRGLGASAQSLPRVAGSPAAWAQRRGERIGWVWVTAIFAALMVSSMALALLVSIVSVLAVDHTIRCRRLCGRVAEEGEDSETIDLTQIDLREPEHTFTGDSELSHPRSHVESEPSHADSFGVATVLRDGVRLSAVLSAASLPLLSESKGGIRAVGLGLALLVLFPMIARLWMGSQQEILDEPRAALAPKLNPTMIEMSSGMLASFTFGIGGALLVLISKMDLATATVLMLIVCSYDIGNHVIGSGSRSRWEGPVAGMTAAGVVGFAAWVVVGTTVGQGVIVGSVAAACACAPFGSSLIGVLLGGSDRMTGSMQRLGPYVLTLPVASYLAAVLR